MRKILSAAIALSLVTPAIMISAPADARHGRKYEYREWRGRDGRLYCRKSDGTTGLVIGAVGGALIGRSIDTRGDRLAGTLIGAAAGGLIGKEIDSNRRCR